MGPILRAKKCMIECENANFGNSASGVAISMELARIMATRRPAATIVFAAVAGEEQGLFGSTFLAQTYKNASVNVQGMLVQSKCSSLKARSDDYVKGSRTIS